MHLRRRAKRDDVKRWPGCGARVVLTWWIGILGLITWHMPSEAAEPVPPVAGVSSEMMALLTRCAPSVHPETMAAVVSGESRGHVFAIADAGPKNLPWSQRKSMVRSLHPNSLEEAVETATSLIGAGHTVSLGLGQVNDRNLPALGLSIREVFDPCVNLSASGKILTEFYEIAVRKFGRGAQALRAALSGYNSGDLVRGDRDGYVDLVFNQRGRALSLQVGASNAAVAKGGNTGVPALSDARLSASGPAGRPHMRFATIRSRPRGFVMEVSDFTTADRIARGEVDMVQQ